MPHLHLQIRGLGGNRPAHVSGEEYLAREGLAFAHHHGGRIRFEFHHVVRRTAPQIEAPSLPHGEVGHPPVPAEHVSLQVHDVARPVDPRFLGPEESAVIILRHEANLLALGLLRGREAQFSGVFPRLLLRELAQGERGARELFLRHAEKEIGLVLLPVKTPGDAQAPGDLHPPGVMAGDEHLRAERHRALGEVVELHHLVALDAGHGRSAVFVLGDEVLDHAMLEGFAHVHHVEGDVELGRHGARIGQVARRATAPVERFLRGPVGEAQPHADGLMALLHHEGRGHRTVHPAAHRHHHALCHHRLQEDAASCQATLYTTRFGRGQMARPAGAAAGKCGQMRGCENFFIFRNFLMYYFMYILQRYDYTSIFKECPF